MNHATASFLICLCACLLSGTAFASEETTATRVPISSAAFTPPIPEYANIFPHKADAKAGPAVLRVRTAGDTMLGNAADGRVPKGRDRSCL